MAGRFPHDAGRQQQQRQQQPPPPQLNPAVRAALGLGPATMDEAKAAFFLQQRQQEIQREVQLRQMFLQEQLEQQSKLDSMLHQQQLRMIGEHLQEFPDLQQHYQNLLLKEQFQRQEERAILQEHAQIRYQEELRRQQQQQQAQQHQQQAQQAQQQQQQQAQQQQQQAQQIGSSQALGPTSAAAAAAAAMKNPNMIRELAAAAESSASGSSMAAAVAAAASLKEASVASQPRKRRISEDSSAVASAGPAVAAAVKRPPRLHQQQSQEIEQDKDRKPRGRPRKIGRGAKRTSLSHRTPTPTDDKKMPSGGKQQQGSEDEWKWMDGEWRLVASTDTQEDDVDEADDDVVEVVNGFASPPQPVKHLGTIEQLIAAAALDIMTDAAVNTIANLKRNVTWIDSDNDDDDEEDKEIQMAARKGETICVTGFKSFLPQLPVEPEFALAPTRHHTAAISTSEKTSNEVLQTNSKAANQHEKATAAAVAQNGTKDHPTVLDSVAPKDPPAPAAEYPYPIDTWWPSVTSIRRERRNNGEESDEDAFTDDPRLVNEDSCFRANHSVIRRRLSTKVEPGVLEKLPHCKVHRMAMKWRHHTSQAELVHCFQVTELYPNDVMVCCSVCGTWRHAKCGGHYKDYSVRECLEEPFQALCDRCHEEEQVLADFPRAQKRIERQRLEQVRRGLATSAVMRQASFSKHGGTYKWPLGSVTLSHFGGHTRSVHSRHDKAEKQWTDMANRLARGHYARQKDRIKVRTKELERLLVSVEDAEEFTDRHNVYVFLMRDTARDRPVGYDQSRRNLFDPEEDVTANVTSTVEKKSPKQDLMTIDHVEESTLQSDNDLVEPMEEEAIGFPLQEANQQLLLQQQQQQQQQHVVEDDVSEEDGAQSEERPSKCGRVGCYKTPRFDSIFCSDACGVSSLESDLLRALNYASDIHPSLFRG